MLCCRASFCPTRPIEFVDIVATPAFVSIIYGAFVGAVFCVVMLLVSLRMSAQALLPVSVAQP